MEQGTTGLRLSRAAEEAGERGLELAAERQHWRDQVTRLEDRRTECQQAVEAAQRVVDAALLKQTQADEPLKDDRYRCGDATVAYLGALADYKRQVAEEAAAYLLGQEQP